MEQTITLAHVVAAMEKTGDMKRPIPFELEWVRADRSKQTGGQLVSAKGITLLRLERAIPRAQRHASTIRDRNTNRNATRDIYYNGREDCVHLFLITKFNGKTVI